ncbi:DnaJ domain-containing protein [Altererythrobacter aerius]|uniref:DnaJ domain-containing protein n=1 Tax=Tsuneonella aeria TaxID=1837929 RepID=A0A6I4TCD4_9SPHN|nr:J domain-containing protein [Tsuneonella aeria]MXO74862.1 DnaJ domain-containing protein [Tsuneonella aeria]
MRATRFHGRHEGTGCQCEAPGCTEAGEFRAPGSRSAGFDGPGDSRWFCLDHVREFNAGYDWFEGMSADEILAAQHPSAGWSNSSTARAFRADAGVGGAPRWADFDDPLDAIGARASDIRRRAAGRMERRAAVSRFSPEERDALTALDLSPDVDLRALRRRYSDLVRRYHPDRNGGDRRHEARLVRVVEAYQLLRRSTALA